MNFHAVGGARRARTFARGDPQYQEWATTREGVYTTNGAVLAVIKRSRAERPLPDLFCFALLGRFDGYFPGYSTLVRGATSNCLTWVDPQGAHATTAPAR